MRLVDRTGHFDLQKTFKGKYKKYDVTVHYSIDEVPYWYYVFIKKDEDCRFNSLWENMRYSTQDECVAACEAKIDELIKRQKRKRV